MPLPSITLPPLRLGQPRIPRPSSVDPLHTSIVNLCKVVEEKLCPDIPAPASVAFFKAGDKWLCQVAIGPQLFLTTAGVDMDEAVLIAGNKILDSVVAAAAEKETQQ